MELTPCTLSAAPSPVFLPRKRRFIVGVDLGQAADSTAIAVLEVTKGFTDHGSEYERHTGLPTKQTPAEYINVRHLRRLPLGLSYPVQVQTVADLLARAPLCGDERQPRADLVLDETGVGRPVADLFDDAGLRPTRVCITAGNETTCVGPNRWHVSKTHLISSVDALLHTGTLRFAAALSEADAMKNELQDFRRKLSDAGRATYSARAGAHDDLVLAVAIAAWHASRPVQEQASTATYGYSTQGYGW
jgi:hypothetical protein